MHASSVLTFPWIRHGGISKELQDTSSTARTPESQPRGSLTARRRLSLHQCASEVCANVSSCMCCYGFSEGRRCSPNIQLPAPRMLSSRVQSIQMRAAQTCWSNQTPGKALSPNVAYRFIAAGPPGQCRAWWDWRTRAMRRVQRAPLRRGS